MRILGATDERVGNWNGNRNSRWNSDGLNNSVSCLVGATVESKENEVFEITHPINMDWTKYVALLQENDRLRAALEKIANVELNPELGQIVDSMHYEAAWLECAGIAREALTAKRGD
jgi:hypothetical protein